MSQVQHRPSYSPALLAHLATGALGSLLALTAPAVAQDSILVADWGGSKIVKLAYPSGAAQTHFVGVSMTDMANVEQMTFGPDGNLYFASYSTNEIIRVNGQTGYPFGATSTFVVAGSGGLNHPVGLAFGPDGNLYVSSYLTHNVLEYSGTTGAFINAFVVASSGSLTNPEGLAFHGGDLYVCSYGNAKVLHYNGSTGAFIDETFSAGQSGLANPRGILFDSSGRMYVTGGSGGTSAIWVKDPSAGISVLASFTTIPLLNTPEEPGLTGDGVSLLVPCHNGSVQKVNRLTGASQGTVVLNGAGGMSTTLTSVLYFANTAPCYANCDGSTTSPVLNVQDFTCFLQKFSMGCP